MTPPGTAATCSGRSGVPCAPAPGSRPNPQLAETAQKSPAAGLMVSRCHLCPHFTEEETEAQRASGRHARSHQPCPARAPRGAAASLACDGLRLPPPPRKSFYSSRASGRGGARPGDTRGAPPAGGNQHFNCRLVLGGQQERLSPQSRGQWFHLPGHCGGAHAVTGLAGAWRRRRGAAEAGGGAGEELEPVCGWRSQPRRLC